jgi:hypothetical protein
MGAFRLSPLVVLATACFNVNIEDIRCADSEPHCPSGYECVESSCVALSSAPFDAGLGDKKDNPFPDADVSCSDGCAALDDACNVGVCNEATNECELEPANAGGACDDGDLCTTEDVCTLGVCAGIDSALDCSGLDGVCTVGACDPTTGECKADPANEGGACDDGDPCTLDDACAAGQCEDTTGSELLFFEDFANPSGWTLGAEWEIGPPQGLCSDPKADHGGDGNVAGVDLSGDGCYDTAVHPPECLTSPVIDASGSSGPLWLSFWRYLRSDYAPYLESTVEVFNGAGWIKIFGTQSPLTLETEWSLQEYDISPQANAALQVRWCVEAIKDSAIFTLGGWNIDDVSVGPNACYGP